LFFRRDFGIFLMILSDFGWFLERIW
jgi:hypothetical protein